MDKSDEFRANAQECQRMADATKNPGDKRRWLQMAETWLRRGERLSASERFDAGQPKLRTSH
jgi:site-specific recombinase